MVNIVHFCLVDFILYYWEVPGLQEKRSRDTLDMLLLIRHYEILSSFFFDVYDMMIG